MKGSHHPTVAWGRAYVKDYTEQEFLDCLWRAFIRDHADFIILDSNPHGQRFVAAATAWALSKSILYCDRDQQGDQERVATFRLTPDGREILEAHDAQER